MSAKEHKQMQTSLCEDGEERREFMTTVAGGLTAVGAACAAWPLVDSLNPSSDVLATSSIEVDLSNIGQGQTLTVMWQGKPIFIKHRTEQEITDSRNVDKNKLPDPERDEDRVHSGHDRWLVVVGICTHLGCIPIGNQGDYDSGWFCPCHGSHYDSSGRIRKGPAPKNLIVPPYTFISDTKVKIG